MSCSYQGCAAAAACAVGLELYPFKATMANYKSQHFLTRLVIALRLCDAHFAELEREGPFALMPRDRIELLGSVASSRCGIRIDVEATKVARVALDDPELLMLERTSAERNA